MASSAQAVEYYCKATRKVDLDHEYSAQQLEKSQFATKVEDFGDSAFLSRCSVSMTEGGKVTCDRYSVDRIEYDENVKIRKFYVFRNQFDFQIFGDLSSLENNGRGSIQFGKCTVTAP